MMDAINILETEERDLLYRAPVLVAILVAGADGNMDKAEIKEAVTIFGMKKVKARKGLEEFYVEIAENFEDKLKMGIADYPADTSDREKIVSDELSGLNEILSKLERKFAIEFYESLKDFARRVAEASGGLLGYMAVGYEESKIIDLKMIKDPS